MDTSESYHRPGGRGGGRGGGGGGWHDNRAPYDNRNYQGGRGGGRSDYYEPQEYRGGQGQRGRGWNQWQGGQSRYQGNFEQGGYHGGGRGDRGRGRGRQQNWGRGNYRNNKWEREKQGREEEEELLPGDVAALAELSGHTNRITTIQFEPNTQQLYTGSADGTVRSWSVVTGQCVSSVDVGGEVDCLLLGGGYLFVGLHKGGEGIIKVWNMATSASHLLTGHKGAVYALAIANTALVSGGQDGTIRVWNFNPTAEIFMSQAIITKEDGGHSSPVHALCVLGSCMFSSDRNGDIVAWDLATGKAAQRLANAHGDQPILQLLPFDNYLLSAGMDGLIRAWQVLEQPMPGMVVRPDPEYVFDKDNPDGAPDGSSAGAQYQQQGGFGRQRRGRTLPGIVTMSGTTDKTGTPVLMVAYNGEPCVRMYDLPEFKSRGVLTPAPDTRSLGSVAGTVMLTGDGKGHVRVFQWK